MTIRHLGAQLISFQSPHLITFYQSERDLVVPIPITLFFIYLREIGTMAESTKVLIPETFQGGSSFDIAGQIGLIWELIKAPLIVPLLRVGVYVSLAMALMLFVERVYMGIVIVLVKMFWKKPEKRYNYEPIQEDLELGSSNFPVVLVQIPMFNEREVNNQ